MSSPGVRVYYGIKAGTFTDCARIDPLEFASCHVCGAIQKAAYDDSMFYVRCGDDCGTVFYGYFCPPSSPTERDREGVLRAASERIKREIASMARDVCPWCCGRMTPQVLPTDAEMPHRDNPAIERRVLHACNTCAGAIYARPGGLLVTIPPSFPSFTTTVST